MPETTQPKNTVLDRLRQSRFSLLHLAIFILVVFGAGYLWKGYIELQMEELTVSFLQSPLPEVKIAEEASQPGVNASEPYKGEYTFTTDWFTWNVPIWQKALAPLKGKPDIRYLEIGVFEGRSALWMLENILTDPTAKMTGVDPFDGPFKERCFANIEASGASDKVTLITGYSQQVMRELPLDSFDVIYIDGSHVKDAVLEDAVLSWRLLKEGGLLIFDDYRFVGYSTPSEDTHSPKPAIDAFAQCFDKQFEVVHNSYQLILRKRIQKEQESEG